jgi:hypothetical protein
MSEKQGTDVAKLDRLMATLDECTDIAGSLDARQVKPVLDLVVKAREKAESMRARVVKK